MLPKIIRKPQIFIYFSPRSREDFEDVPPKNKFREIIFVYGRIPKITFNVDVGFLLFGLFNEIFDTVDPLSKRLMASFFVNIYNFQEIRPLFVFLTFLRDKCRYRCC